MGYHGIYTCQDCKNEFEAREGGGIRFIEYRCVNCDVIKKIFSNQHVPIAKYVKPTAAQVGVCDKCGGELRDDIHPMCPACKSRNVKHDNSAAHTIAFYD